MAKWLELIFNIPVSQSFFYKNELSKDIRSTKKAKHTETGSLVGKRVVVSFGARKMTGFIINETDTLPSYLAADEEKIKPVLRIADKEALFSQVQIELSLWISRFYMCGQGEALSAILPSGKREVLAENSSLNIEEFGKSAVCLSLEQEKAVTEITLSGKKEETSLFYLYGLTASGKTEVFLQSAERLIKAGKSVIYLVPEISLTHQVINDALQRFGNKAAVLHSGLTGSKRLSEWRRIKNGEAKIVIGTRSAVFAPVQNPGLIIIDEEHDSSYKSGSSPRYHARQVAMHLASIQHFPVVMGSATPSVEAWYMMHTGVIKKLSLTKRLAGGRLPDIEVVSLCGVKGALSSRLIEEMRNTKNAGMQTVLFLNRRGFSHVFHCRDCGFELLCKNCSVPMTWHKKQNAMKCHYCGSCTAPPNACPKCKSLNAGYAGIGTEFIEEEVMRTFPDCIAARLDTDTAQANKNTEEIIQDFRNGKIDILLGTQMVAKGLNFPKVRLTGIVCADTGLRMPDFRAAERTFALITQAAGRAGRYLPNGKVIIQTLQPEHPAIVCAKNFDMEGFYNYELNERQMLKFPPFTRLIRLVFRSKNALKAENACTQAALMLKNNLPANIEVMGPSECMISLLAGNYRMQLLLRSASFSIMKTAVSVFKQKYTLPNGVYLEIDTDPLSML